MTTDCDMATDWPEVSAALARKSPKATLAQATAALGQMVAAAELAAAALRTLGMAAEWNRQTLRPEGKDERPLEMPHMEENARQPEMSVVAEHPLPSASVTLGELAALGLAVHGRSSIAAALDPLLERLPPGKQRLRGQLAAAATMADSYRQIQGATTTDANEGALEGAMSGMSMGDTMAGALNFAGPWGAVAGVLLGGLFGSSEARKRAEREAQRIREAQLNELRRLNNALAPVSDYFNRGAFGALTASQSYGGGLSVDYNWAVQSRRGLRG